MNWQGEENTLFSNFLYKNENYKYIKKFIVIASFEPFYTGSIANF